jgi:hypothetical protein
MAKDKKIQVTASSVEHCKCSGCKKTEARFTFCDEHYEWFKFGLISKTGAKVSDFDKKMDHYASYVAKQKQYAKAA